MGNEFTDFVEDVIRRPEFGSKRSLATALKMSDSAFWRQAREGTLGLVPLLRLSIAASRPPLDVLRLAGKHEEADLIEELWGTSSAPMADVDRRWLDLEPAVKNQVIGIAQQLSEAMRVKNASPIRDGTVGKQSAVKQKRTS